AIITPWSGWTAPRTATGQGGLSPLVQRSVQPSVQVAVSLPMLIVWERAWPSIPAKSRLAGSLARSPISWTHVHAAMPFQPRWLSVLWFLSVTRQRFARNAVLTFSRYLPFALYLRARCHVLREQCLPDQIYATSSSSRKRAASPH